MSLFTSNIETYNDLLEFEKDPNILKFLKNKFFDDNYSKYSLKDEKKLLSLLKTKESSVEKYIASLKDKRLNYLTILDFFAFKLYGLKLLHKNGIDGFSININSANHPTLRGGIKEETKEIVVYKNSDHMHSVYDIVKTLHHECMHAIEHRNTYELRYKEDRDTFMYIKDRFIKSRVGNAYYENNYFNISYEYDAEFKAIMLTDELFNIREYRFQECREFINCELNNLKNTNLLIDVENKIKERGFELESTRIYENKKYSLNVLYDIVASEFIKKIAFKIQTKKMSYSEAREYIKEINPLLYYDSDFKRRLRDNEIIYIWRKSIANLVEEIINTDDESLKEIYYNLIESKIDPRSGYCLNDRSKLYDGYVKEFNKVIKRINDLDVVDRLKEIYKRVNNTEHYKNENKKESFNNIRR